MRVGTAVLLVGVGCLIGIGGTIGVQQLANGDDDSPGDPKLSILDRPRTASDALPASVMSSPLGERIEDPDSMRRALTTTRATYFVVPTKDQAKDSLCLVRKDRTGAGISCDGWEALAHGAIAMYQPDDADTIIVSGIAPDGYEYAGVEDRIARVRNNVFEIPNAPKGGLLVLDGKTVAPRSIYLASEDRPETEGLGVVDPDAPTE